MNKVLVCPECGTGDVLRSHCFSFVEWLADALWISPFRCQQCGHRFSALRVGRCYSARLVDRREYKRIPVRLSLSFSRGRIGGKGTVTDISMGGCVIESDAPVKTDDILYLQLYIATHQPPIEVAAMVRSVTARGIGVKFLRAAHDNKRLLAFLHAHGA
ncbi:MAG: PilZ domain-containing protein [Nitrospiraceae bacterium]|nr:PilZ domain-containing protein [Nitrospiraceae bacterium]